MSKPIIFEQAMKDNALAEFDEFLEQFTNGSAREKFIRDLEASRMEDGKISYKDTFTYEKTFLYPTGSGRALIIFEPLAYIKMSGLINKFDSEVAWHGTVRRGEDPEHFIIYDIFVYPQEVSGATVNTDQEEYQKWLIGLDDDVANNLLFQGHSHVNMAPIPSAVDVGHRNSVLSQVKKDGFYIFGIFNKKGAINLRIYDMENNVLYEPDDITATVNGCAIAGFLTDSDKLVQTKKYQYQNNYQNGYSSYEK